MRENRKDMIGSRRQGMAQAIMSSRITIIRGAGDVPVAGSALRERRAPSPADDRPNPSPNLDPASGPSPAPAQDDNPFAPPAKGAPVQPWQPRHPVVRDGEGSPEGQDGQDRDSSGGERWSSRQPAPHNGGSQDQGPFGTGPGGMVPPGYGGGPGRQPGQVPGGPQGVGPRFDFTDPVQRRARYSLLSGMWALFFGLFGLPQVALLLGALAMYWGISSLRGKAKPPAEQTGADRPDPLSSWQSPGSASVPRPGAGHPGPGGSSPYGGGPHKPQLTAAVCGTIAASLALVIVAATFSFQIAYKGYYDCVNDALTQPARQSCNQLLPRVLRNSFANQD